MLYETKYLISLSVTSIIEIPIVFFLVKYLYKIKEIKTVKILFIGFVASALTLPYLWFILPPYFNARYYIFIGELLVTFFEAIFYYQLLNTKWWQSLTISIIANLCSFIIGLIFLNNS